MSKFFKVIYYSILLAVIIISSHQIYYYYKLRKAQDLYLKQKHKEAIVIYENIQGKIAYLPPIVYYTKYKIYKNLCDNKKALSSLEKYVQKVPGDIPSKIELAEMYHLQNKIDSAISILVDIAKSKKDNPVVYNLLYLLFYEKDDLKNAEFYAKKYYEINPSSKVLSDINLIKQEMYFSHNLKKIEGSNFIVKYYPALDSKISQYILQTLENTYHRVYGFLSFENKYKTIVKIFDTSTFDKIIGNTSSNIHATVINNKLLIKAPSVMIASGNLAGVISHEYIHLLLHKIAKQKVPLWLNEGLAEFFSKNDLSVTEKRILQKAISTNTLFSFSELENDWNFSGEWLTLAYVQSYCLTSFIIDEFGVEKLIKIIQLLSCGEKSDKAIFFSLGINLEELQKRWIAKQLDTFKNNW